MPDIRADITDQLTAADLADLCDATEAAIDAGGGFGWLAVPARDRLERYWQGVLAVPERTLITARLDGAIAGSAQLVRPPAQNEAQAFAIAFTTAFVAPWAQGRGLARATLDCAIGHARYLGFDVLNLDVRETQSAAISLYEARGFRRWGIHPHYARVGGRMICGYYYTLALNGGQPDRPDPGE